MVLKNVLVSQHIPSDVYQEIKNNYDINICFKPFIEVRGVRGNEFRKTNIIFSDHSSVIMTSKYAVDHYFRISEELKFKVPDSNKYFCLNEYIANYLQKYIVYRKRRIFFGNNTFDSLIERIKEKGEFKDKYFLPCSDNVDNLCEKLGESSVFFQKVKLFEIICTDLKDFNIDKYDAILFFTPKEIESLFQNYSDFKQNHIRIGTFGENTKSIAEKKGLVVNIEAPTKEFPSMVMALHNYIRKHHLV